ncbi:hypothetical protein F5Y19DRAFT_485258 [Xylariaceae sp. FL1651]|nr:hypothetical protein F5Y19DRAFT_485258 [Xylariaceae sp. FL1651]
MVGTTKYTDEQIHFILDKTVRQIPRGKTNDVYCDTVREFKERYGIEEFGLNQVRYVTERYGTDPVYGNRWANLPKPQAPRPPIPLPDEDDLPMPFNMTPGAKRILRRGANGRYTLCTHCDGTGLEAFHRPKPSQARSGQQMTQAQTSGELQRALEYSTYRQTGHRLIQEDSSSASRLPPPGHRRQSSAIQQPVQSSQLRTYASPSASGMPNNNQRTDSSTEAFPERGGLRYDSKRPTTSSYGVARETESKSGDRHMSYSYTSPTPAQQNTDGEPGSSGTFAEDSAFACGIPSSSLHYSTPTWSGPSTASGATLQTPLPYRFPLQNTGHYRGLIGSTPGHTPGPVAASSSSALGKRQRSTSTSDVFSGGPGLAKPSRSPYNWRASSNAMYPASSPPSATITRGINRGTPADGTLASYGDGQGGLHELATKKTKTEGEETKEELPASDS